MRDEELIDRIRIGETEALDLLVETHYPEVYRYVRRLTNDPYVSDDITQDVFVRVIQTLPRYRQGNFPGYLLTVAHHACMDHFRGLQRSAGRQDAYEEMEEIADTAPGPAKHLESREAEDEASRLLAVLSLAQREVVVLRVFHDMELKEIGRVLHISLSTVKSRLYGGLANLKKEADAHGKR